LTAETKYGGTVTNVKRKRVPGGGSSYSKTTRAKACGRTCGTANKLQTVNNSRTTICNVYCSYYRDMIQQLLSTNYTWARFPIRSADQINWIKQSGTRLASGRGGQPWSGFLHSYFWLSK